MTRGGAVGAWRALPGRQRALLTLLAVAVALANVAQPYPEIAPLQHVPTVAALLAAPWLLRRWPLSDGSLGAIVAFLLLHTLAGRYTYSNVPYDRWLAMLTGHDAGAGVGQARNGFDRVVHFSFGLLAMRPVAEIVRRHGGAGARAAGWTAFLFVGAASAAYEVFEWLLTMVLAPDLAADYNGQQGDPWDAQKDMAMAMLGAMLAAALAGLRGRRA